MCITSVEFNILVYISDMRPNSRRKNLQSRDLFANFQDGDFDLTGTGREIESRYTPHVVQKRCDPSIILNCVQSGLVIVGFIIMIMIAINYQTIFPYLDAYSNWAADQISTWEGQLLIFIAYICGTMINVPNTALSVFLGYTI